MTLAQITKLLIGGPPDLHGAGRQLAVWRFPRLSRAAAGVRPRQVLTGCWRHRQRSSLRACNTKYAHTGLSSCQLPAAWSAWELTAKQTGQSAGCILVSVGGHGFQVCGAVVCLWFRNADEWSEHRRTGCITARSCNCNLAVRSRLATQLDCTQVKSAHVQPQRCRRIRSIYFPCPFSRLCAAGRTRRACEDAHVGLAVCAQPLQGLPHAEAAP